MGLYLEVRDLNEQWVFDEQGLLDHFENLVFTWQWPKGCATCNFRVKTRDPFQEWAVRPAYTLLVKQGTTVIWDGEIIDIKPSQGGGENALDIEAVGWWERLEATRFWGWWIDRKPLSRLDYLDSYIGEIYQNQYVRELERDYLRVRYNLSTADITITTGDYYRETYKMPGWDINLDNLLGYNQFIRRFAFDWRVRSGENPQITIYDEVNGLSETSGRTRPGSNVDPLDGTTDCLFTNPDVRYFTMRFDSDGSETYDNNDWWLIRNAVVYANYQPGHPNYASPNYTQGEIVRDLMLLTGGFLSANLDLIQEPGYALDPFTIEEPTPVSAILERIAAKGDSQLRTWGAGVLTRQGTNDDKPRFYFEPLTIDNYEYEISLTDRELAQINLAQPVISVENFGWIGITDSKDRRDFIFPGSRADDDFAELMSQASIDRYRRRDFYIDIGEGSESTAKYAGQRRVQFHAEPLRQGSFAVQGLIRTKDGGLLPVAQVRAGQRVLETNSNTIYFIRQTSYDAEQDEVRITPGLPEDNINQLLAQRREGIRA